MDRMRVETTGMIEGEYKKYVVMDSTPVVEGPKGWYEVRLIDESTGTQYLMLVVESLAGKFKQGRIILL
jgi:hypothetical protein